MPNIGWPEILIILLVVVVLFGASKLPELARSMGRSLRIFKSELKEMKNENSDKKAEKKDKKKEEILGAEDDAAEAVVVEEPTIAEEVSADKTD
ncbi:MAG: Sec-independent protein translocase subunit TatA [Lawsonella sp.]